MATLIKPKQKLINLDTPKKDDDSEGNQIPRDPEGIKEYLEIIPEPVGWRMLIRPYQPSKKTKGGVILADTTRETMQMTTVVGLVVKMGPDCYKDKIKFPDGPWCKKGQFIIYGRYAGSRFQTKYGEHRILNDDEIIGTIKKPENILHLF
jgi:co-chaperonin GroES (HSP10)|tara:strand:- start:1707 stop:2156 length:450 start_codon:yes stop_codon:yes gene_type:complete